MNIVDTAKRAKSALMGSSFPRLMAALMGGTLVQRAVAIVGVGMIAIGIYLAIWPLILSIVGAVLVWLSLNDYERTVASRRRDP